MSFSKKPKTTNENIKDFINEPVSGSNEYKNNTNTKPWSEHDKLSKKRSVFNIRFNGYYENAYKYFSKKMGYDSYQNFVRGIVERELDQLIENESK